MQYKDKPNCGFLSIVLTFHKVFESTPFNKKQHQMMLFNTISIYYENYLE